VEARASRSTVVSFADTFKNAGKKNATIAGVKARLTNVRNTALVNGIVDFICMEDTGEARAEILASHCECD
jgi:hypothetical protein